MSRETDDQPLLFDYWRSSASYRVRIALNLKGIDYQSQSVDLVTGEQTQPAHLDRNPQGLVPVLQIDGLRLTQSLAIIDYLNETRPDPPLLPPDPAGRARVRALAHLIAMDIHPICNLRVVNRITELANNGQEGKIAWMQEHIAAGLSAYERLLDHPSTGRYSHGGQPSIADCCLISQLYNAKRWNIPLQRFSKISEIDAICAQIPAFETAHPDKNKPNNT